MLERYYIRPETIDRISASWIKEPIEQYVRWLAERGYAPRNVFHRVPILRRFGEFARARGASTWKALPEHVDAFVTAWVRERARQRGLKEARPKLASEIRRPVEQMLRLVVAGFTGRGRPRAAVPFQVGAPGFFPYLRAERGLRAPSSDEFVLEEEHQEVGEREPIGLRLHEPCLEAGGDTAKAELAQGAEEFRELHRHRLVRGRDPGGGRGRG